MRCIFFVQLKLKEKLAILFMLGSSLGEHWLKWLVYDFESTWFRKINLIKIEF